MVNATDRAGRLGREFGKLWTASTFSGLGDGATQIAGTLLAASLTRDPIQVAGLMMVQILPFVVFGLPSGVLVDRLGRRRLMIAASVIRVCALGVLGLAVATEYVGLPLLYAVFFLVGCAGLVFDNASTTSLPAVVGHAQLERANGRLQATKSVSEQLLARPLGAWLFGVAAWAPFLLDAGGLVLIAILVATLPAALNRPAPGPHGALGAAIAEGARWLLFGNPLLRTLTLTVGLSNIGLGAVFAILVLVAHERLGVGSVGYAVLITMVAVGGVIGGLTASRIVTMIGPGTALRVGLIIEILSYLGMAVTRNLVIAVLILVPFGMHLAVFSTIGASLRQSLVPTKLLGRVHSAYRLVGAVGMFVGAGFGGVLARYYGLTAPFWLGLCCAAVFTAGAWRILNDREIRTARAAADRPPDPV